MNILPEPQGFDLTKQIEELKHHLQQDDTASKLVKSGITLSQIVSQYDSISKQLLVTEEELKSIQSSYNQLSQENDESLKQLLSARKDVFKEKLKAEKAQEKLRFDQKCRANTRHQREKEVYVEQLRQSVASRHGYITSESPDQQAFETEMEWQLEKHSLMVKYSELEKDFKKEVEREVGKRMMDTEDQLKDFKAELGRLQECRGVVRDAYKRIEDLVEERETYLRAMKEAGIPVPIIEVRAQEDLDEGSPTQKRNRESCDLGNDEERSRLTEDKDEGAQLAEQNYEEEEEWLGSSEEEEDSDDTEEEEVNENLTLDENDMEENPAAAVSSECSPVTSKSVCRLHDSFIPTTSDLIKGTSSCAQSTVAVEPATKRSQLNVNDGSTKDVTGTDEDPALRAAASFECSPVPSETVGRPTEGALGSID